MISAKFRNALSATALFIIFGGPILAVLGLLGALIFGEGSAAAVATGAAIRFFFGSILAGGILRLLVSIDARLEARA